MNKLAEIIENYGDYGLSQEGLSALAHLKSAFDTNPFFPENRYDYARRNLYEMHMVGLISAEVMTAILEDF